jgi:hypothetical protein
MRPTLLPNPGVAVGSTRWTFERGPHPLDIRGVPGCDCQEGAWNWISKRTEESVTDFSFRIVMKSGPWSTDWVSRSGKATTVSVHQVL